MNPTQGKSSFQTPLLTFIILSISIILIGVYTFIQQRDHLNQFAKEQLEGIAKLKVKLIALNRDERLIDASNLAKDIAFIDEFKKWQENRSNKELLRRIKYFLGNVSETTYSHYCLLGSDYSILISDSTGYNPIDSCTISNLAIARETKKPLLSDIYFNQNDRMVQMDLIVPLFSQNNFAGVIIMKIDLYKNFFPAIQEWLTPSKSAETLLAERMDTVVVYLNELRHVHNTPLKLFVPMSDTNVLAVQGFSGHMGIIEGKDYRKVDVIGAVEKVPGTNWLIVAKMDKEEISAPVYQQALLIFTAVLLLIGFAGIILYFQWKNFQHSQRAQLLESELSRRQVKSELEESEQRFQTMFHSMNEGAVLHELVFDENDNAIDYRLISINPAFEAHTGIEVSRGTGALGSELYGLIPPPYFDIYTRVALTGEPFMFETYFPPLNKYFQISVFSPKKNWFTTIFLDITQSKLTENLIRESEEKFRGIFENSPIGKAMIDLEGKMQVNSAFCILLGYTQEEFKALRWQDFTHPDDIADTAAMLESLLSGKINSGRHEKRYIHKNGSILWVDATIFLHRDPDGKPKYFIKSFIEITQKRNMEEALRRNIDDLQKTELQLTRTLQNLELSNKELEQFAYVASHDLQEPLRMVSSYTQLLAKKYFNALDADALDYIKFAVDGAVRMQLLINDLLDYSRITKQNHSLESVSSSMVLGLAIVNLRKKIEESHAVITNDRLPNVISNASQLVHVFQNLIDNAIKYNDSGIPLLHISATLLEDEYCFSFTDNGIGINEEYKERIFEIFERLHSAQAYPGTGIGLAICKKIVEKHGGKIWVKPNTQKGATFYFTLKKGTV